MCTFQQGVDEVSKLFQLSPAQDVFIESVSLGNCSPLPYELLHHAFEERANSHPGVPAIQHEGVVLSYKELNDRANTLAAMLTSNGVLVGSRVAVITDRCLEFPIGLLATLKAGAAMMPLDVAFPVGRLAFMLADAQVVAIIATKKHEQHIQEVIRAMAITTISVLFICNEELQSSPKKFATQQIPTRSDEAYIVYTSGSTGTPKGVPVLHAGAVNLTAFPYQPLAYQVGMRVMQNMAIGFDWCQEEVWKTLSNGATLVLRGENVFDTLTLVDVVSCTPTALAHFGHPSQYPNLKYVEVGGESISTSLKDLWSPYVCLTNTYGPSECSSTTHSVQLTQTTQVNVGRPTVNVNSYILDARHCRVPIGVLGELYLGGICVSSGYINLPQETETKFLDDPFTGGRMYRTGDIARLLANGNVEIVGRNDSQVKLKGYRIELDEVAGAIMQHPNIVLAAALVKDKSHLVGYYTPTSVHSDELQEFVATKLPPYMVPAVWVGLDIMPQNSNGKIDKKALEVLDVVVDAEALTSECEHLMASIWAKVLNIDVSDIGRRTSFFALGGDSFTSVKVVAACKEIGLHVTTGQLLRASSLWQVASVVSGTGNTPTYWPRVQLPDDIILSVEEEWGKRLSLTKYDVFPVTPLQASLIAVTMKDKGNSYIGQVPILLGENLDEIAVSNVYHAIVGQHEILRTTFVSTDMGIFQIFRHDTQALEIEFANSKSIDQFLLDDHIRGFEIGDKCFARFTIVHTQMSHFGVFTIHHALYDGWSMPMLMEDIMNTMEGKALKFRPSFRNIVNYIEAQDKTATEGYWRAYLNGFQPCPIGSIGHLGGNMSSECESQLSIQTQSSMADMKSTGLRIGMTVAELAKFAWALTMQKYTRKNDVVFAQVLANRDIPIEDADRIIGPLMNVLPCRMKFNGLANSLVQLTDSQTDRDSMLKHSHAGMIDIKRWSGLEGICDTLFLYQQLPQMPDEREKCHEQVRQRESLVMNHSNDFTYKILIEPNDINLSVQTYYNPSTMSYRQARWMLAEFDHSLTQLCTFQQGVDEVSKLFQLSPAQDVFIESVSLGNCSPLPYELLHHAFEERANSHPGVPAIQHEGVVLSYKELNDRANTLAAMLTSNGVLVGSRVAVITDRCLEFPIGLLATLKAGAAMMPLDVAFPVGRLAFMLADAQVVAIIATKKHEQHIQEVIRAMAITTISVLFICNEELQSSPKKFATQQIPTRSDEAYIVYTSGSTGTPKGVPVLHAGAVGMRVMQNMAIGFDWCQEEVWKTLSNGATLVLRGENVFDTLTLVDVVSLPEFEIR
ncbi:Aste57867_4464 [Aphanomyces stellatus]|uniref:Aste57867_4464 protein n=1 Tax=Aphanomyces stellatus TaxID=120398 RepID=A0A485KGM1_9STRA|nr:hypothetical protein As57867_004452 [Aphanomyces stellatus]VFT81575.1 Aste57867_4464 [Aphanomyces stellatus]